MLSLLLSFFFFPPPLKIDGQASLPFGKRLGNDSSRKHPPGYPASVPPLRQITPRRQQWAKQCNSRFIVSRAGYELRKLAESRGGPIIVPRLRDSTRWAHTKTSCKLDPSVQRHRGGARSTEKWAGTGSARAIHPAFCVTDCANDVAANDLREVERRVTSVSRPFRKIHLDIDGFFPFPSKFHAFLFSSKCLESCRDVRLKSKVHLDFGSSISNLEIGFSCHFFFFLEMFA